MEVADWCGVIDSARSLGCRRVQFIGGEPTVHPDLGRLLEHAHQSGYRQIMVSTNATLLHGDLLERLRRLGVRVSISFYSADEQAHDRITGEVGSFKQTIEGIRQLVEHRISIQAGIIQMDENAGSYRTAHRLLRRLGVRFIGKDRVRSIGRGRRYFENPSPPAEQLCGNCWNRRLLVSANGDAYPCTFARFASVGNVLDDGLEAVVAGSALSAFRRAQYLGEEGG
jgi:MoaA/NifB/PqqE/SkfB family radical SAM enzyme